MGTKKRTWPLSPRSAANITRLYRRSARSRGDRLLMSGAGMALPVPSEGEGEGDVPAVFFWVVIRNSSRPESNATLAPATIHGRGCRFPTAVSDRPQDWQKREPARMVASQRG